MMNYNEAVLYIGACNGTVVRLGLERIRELLSLMNNPQDSLRIVHIAGTNGKGSTAAMLSSVLSEAGCKTGTFCSPSILSINDTISLNGIAISNADFAEITEYVKGYADKMQDCPSGFELQTAVAFEYFKRKKTDIVVLEAGLGGRLDATNAVSHSLLSVITGISLDHTAFLGNTTREIAYQKAGIIKNGSTVIFGGTDPAVAEVIRRSADSCHSEMLTVSYSELTDIRTCLLGTHFSTEKYKNLYIPLLGSFQPKNAMIVLYCIDVLKKHGYKIPQSAVFSGLKKATHPGRFELILKNPPFITDGAHNPEGIHSAVNSIKEYFSSKVNLIIGVMRDKDFSEIVTELSEITECAFTAPPDNPRALNPEVLSDLFKKNGVKASSFHSADDAAAAALSASEKNGLPIVSLGSLYMYKDICRAVENLPR